MKKPYLNHMDRLALKQKGLNDGNYIQERFDRKKKNRQLVRNFKKEYGIVDQVFMLVIAMSAIAVFMIFMVIVVFKN